MTRRKGYESLSFDEAILREPQRIVSSQKSRSQFSYVGRGLYAKQVKRFLDLFGRNQVMVVSDKYLTKSFNDFLDEFSSWTNCEITIPVSSLKHTHTRKDSKAKWVAKLFEIMYEHPFFSVIVRVAKRYPYLYRILKAIKEFNLYEPEKSEFSINNEAVIDCLRDDAKELDNLLGTKFYRDWFSEEKN